MVSAMASTTGAVARGKRLSDFNTFKGLNKAMASLEQDIGYLLRQKGLTLGVVESASGGRW